MKPTHKPKYQIKRTEQFIRKCQDLKKSYSRVQELIQSIDWHLSRKPHYFSNISGDYYVLKTGLLSNPQFPQLSVLYLINEEEDSIMLIDINE
jgi:hypothetical protein